MKQQTLPFPIKPIHCELKKIFPADGWWGVYRGKDGKPPYATPLVFFVLTKDNLLLGVNGACLQDGTYDCDCDFFCREVELKLFGINPTKPTNTGSLDNPCIYYPGSQGEK